ncbi:DUF6146 family protein [Aureivirga marina]|uniref:DUF6146 family protein n=1 Tax=Aureivirga marina TaxID=1182451 RepID=UPI0018CB7EB9|nr:DUF6146 family protein [Aureivirga marina]
MRKVLFIFLMLLLYSCGSTKNNNSTVANAENAASTKVSINQTDDPDDKDGDGDDIEYQIDFYDPGFQPYLETIAKPKGYYSLSYLENHNVQYVAEWNIRVNQPFKYNPNIYQDQIQYDPSIDYGYDVNWELYNFFQYMMNKYNFDLGY